MMMWATGHWSQGHYSKSYDGNNLHLWDLHWTHLINIHTYIYIYGFMNYINIQA